MNINFLSKSIFQTKPDYFGLDLSDSSIKWVQFKKNPNGEIIPLIFHNQKIEEGIIENGAIKNEEKLINILRSTHNDLKKEFGLPKFVVSSLPEQETFIKVIQIPKISQSELATTVRFEAEENIPLNIEDIYFDWQIIPSGLSMDHFDLLLAAISKNISDNYASVLERAGFEVIALELESQAIARALIPNFFSEKPILLVDFGANATSLSIFLGKFLRLTTTVAISGKHINEELALKLKISGSEAEKIKFSINLEKEKRDKNAEIIIPLIDNLSERINDYLSFYASHATHEHEIKEPRISKIILCGGDAKLFGLPEYLSEKLNLPVEIGNPLVNLKISKTSEIKIPKKELLCYTTAIGLAMREMSGSAA